MKGKFFIAKPKVCIETDLPKKEKSTYNSYKLSAEKRGYKFNINESQFKHLISSNCFFCGALPREYSTGEVRNGIDRVDNKVGYEHDNVVTCCTSCNKMKGVLSYSEFINKIDTIKNKIDEFCDMRDEYGPEAPEMLAYMFKHGKYLSPNQILECVTRRLLKKSEIGYSFKQALKDFPKEYIYTLPQLRTLGLNKVTRKVFNKLQLQQWNSL